MNAEVLMAARFSLALAVTLLAGLAGCNAPTAAQEPQIAKPLEQAGPVPVAAFRSSSKYGFIDRQGRIILKPKYDDAHDFFEGLAFVREGKKAAFIDTDGRIKITLPEGASAAR